MASRNEPAFDAEEMFEGLRDWVLTESPTVHVAGVNAMMDKAEAAMARLGASIARQPLVKPADLSTGFCCFRFWSAGLVCG